MRNLHPMERLGLILLVLGLGVQLIHGFWEENPLNGLTRYHSYLFWGGVAVWAIGLLQRRKHGNG